MSRRIYSVHQRAEAIAARANGESSRSIGRRLNINPQSVTKWYLQDGPRMGRTPEALGELIYDIIVVQLAALRAQSVATSRAEWLERQTAEAIARLVEVEWNQLIRVIASIQPRRPGPDGSASALDSAEGFAGSSSGYDDGDREAGSSNSSNGVYGRGPVDATD